ncbi:MAG: DinB family protein [bacterium]
MHPRIQEVLDHLDTNRAALEQAIASVPSDMRSARPAPDKWSVAEVIDHLATVETRVDTLLVGEIAKAKANGIPAESESSAVVKEQLTGRLLDRSQPLVASEASQPKGVAFDVSWTTLTDMRRQLRDAIISADGLALGDVRAPHPRLGEITLYEWIAFLGAHEARHAEQIREVSAVVGG